MAINITDPDALDKLAEIEGIRWRNEQNNLDGYSFGSFRQRYEELLQGDSEELKVFPDLPISIDGNTAIYGSGGWNRYFVRSNGEIVFSKTHARRNADVQKASELGITVR